ncbi:MAG: hypothetical protein NT121_13920 [Chloroflexi bacterium]|nr:hypothetical protein [Chloroflexota bacterium]
MARPRDNTPKPRRMLVEGTDDLHLVANLCVANGIPMPKTFFISDKEGIDNLLSTLYLELEDSELKILGILVDADTDLQARWQSLHTILTRVGYAVPAKPVPTGTILHDEDKPTVGIWLMPDNHLPGMLEDFAAMLIPDNDVLLPYARECVQQLPEQRFPQVQHAKADIHTWLAWQDEPGKPLGIAITARYLNPESAQAQVFITWLRALFLA